jgi:hypothetical protein|tara:strand:+ start:1314 stop:1472 length:159 start_codon:yes stop_codon:yes gene_type:complete
MKKKTGDVFDAILQIPLKIMPDAKMDDKGWWSFTAHMVNLDSNSTKISHLES